MSRFDAEPDPFAGVPDVDERICDWVDGSMSARDRERFEAELRVSPQLRQQVDEYETMVADIRDALQQPIEDVALADRVMATLATRAAGAGPRPRSTWPLVFALASAAALLAIAVWVDSWSVPLTPERDATAAQVEDRPAKAPDLEGAPAAAKDRASSRKGVRRMLESEESEVGARESKREGNRAVPGEGDAVRHVGQPDAAPVPAEQANEKPLAEGAKVAGAPVVGAPVVGAPGLGAPGAEPERAESGDRSADDKRAAAKGDEAKMAKVGDEAARMQQPRQDRRRQGVGAADREVEAAGRARGRRDGNGDVDKGVKQAEPKARTRRGGRPSAPSAPAPSTGGRAPSGRAPFGPGGPTAPGPAGPTTGGPSGPATAGPAGPGSRSPQHRGPGDVVPGPGGRTAPSRGTWGVERLASVTFDIPASTLEAQEGQRLEPAEKSSKPRSTGATGAKKKKSAQAGSDGFLLGSTRAADDVALGAWFRREAELTLGLERVLERLEERLDEEQPGGAQQRQATAGEGRKVPADELVLGGLRLVRIPPPALPGGGGGATGSTAGNTAGRAGGSGGPFQPERQWLVEGTRKDIARLLARLRQQAPVQPSNGEVTVSLPKDFGMLAGLGLGGGAGGAGRPRTGGPAGQQEGQQEGRPGGQPELRPTPEPEPTPDRAAPKERIVIRFRARR